MNEAPSQHHDDHNEAGPSRRSVLWTAGAAGAGLGLGGLSAGPAAAAATTTAAASPAPRAGR